MIIVRTSSRAVSPVVGTVLLVAIVVVLAASVSVFVLQFGDVIGDPAPTVASASGTLVTQDGNDGGIVRLRHVQGDDLLVSDLEIAVDAEDACGKTGRLVNLPAEGGDPRPTDEYVRGDDLFDNSYNSVGGPIGEANGVWTSGEVATFRIAGTPCPLTSGDRVTVRVVHTPSNSIVIQQTLTVS